MPLPLSIVGSAQGDGSKDIASAGEDQDMQPSLDLPHDLETKLTVISADIRNDLRLIERHSSRRGERQSVLGAIDLVLAGIELDLHSSS